MTDFIESGSLVFLILHFFNASLLVLIVNWFGSPGIAIGYVGIHLFDDGSGQPAFNFLLKAISPTIFIIIESIIAYRYNQDHLVIDIYTTVYFYFAIRLFLIFFFNREYLVNWPVVFFRYIVGIVVAEWAYKNLIVPRSPITPDISAIGNELWIIIGLFIYKAVNSAEFPFLKERGKINAFIKYKYEIFNINFGPIIRSQSNDLMIEIAIFSILILEDYNRPKFVRSFENLFPNARTKGIMQLSSDREISDEESISIVISNFNKFVSEFDGDRDDQRHLFQRILGSHNKDWDYILMASEIASTIAFRIDSRYEKMYRNVDKYADD